MLNNFGTFNGVGLTASETIGGQVPIWQNPQDLQKDQGGFTLANAPTAPVLIPGGSPVEVNEATRTAGIGFRFVVYEDAGDTATAIKVVKYSTKYGPLAEVGMNIMKMPAALTTAGAAYAISSIDTTTSLLYDEITLGTTLGVALTAGDVLAEADSAHASTAKLLYAGDRLSYEDIYVQDDAIQYSVAGVYFGSIYDRRIRTIAAIEKANMPQINFSQSK